MPTAHLLPATRNAFSSLPTSAANDRENTALPYRSRRSTRHFSRALTIAAAAAMVLAGGISGASAQTDATTANSSAAPSTTDDAKTLPVVLDAFTVSGLRANIIKAEETKRNAPQVVDAINAEDIGKFPDRSLGEAMQRIPGVQISRDHGEATQVLVRGLPDIVTTVNGDDIFTGNGRRLAMQDLPVEALAGVQVFKTATPDQQEGGIAGLMNAQLRSPFDFKGLTASAYFDTRYTTPHGTHASSYFDPSFGGLVSNRWKTSAGELGLLVDAAYIKDRYNNPIQWLDVPDRVWAVDSSGNGYRLDDSTMVNGKYVAPAGTRLAVMPMVGGVYAVGERKRPMVHSALQWKPSDNLELHAQFLYMGYRSRWEDDFLFSVDQWATKATNVVVAPEGPYTNTIFGDISTIISADNVSSPFGVDPYTASSTQAHDSKTDTFYGSTGLRYNLGNLTWRSDLSLVNSKYHDNRVIVDQNVPSPTLSLYSVDKYGHGGFKVTTPTSSDPLADPAQYTLRGLFQSWDAQSGSQVAWRNDFKYSLSNPFIRALDGGVRIATHNAVNHHAEGGADVPDPAHRPAPVSVFGASFENLVPGVDRLGGAFATPSANFLLDQADTVRKYYGLAPGPLPENPNAMFNQDETSGAVYLQALYDFQIGGIGIKGDLGARAVRTDRTLRGKNSVGEIRDASGNIVTPAHIDDINIKGHNNNVLPSASTVVTWLPKLQSHLSVGKTIRMPDFAQLNPALNATPATINRPGSASAGNPNLKPVTSTNYDATLEYYFEKNGFVQASAFYRDINGYYQTFGQYEYIEGQQYLVNRPNNSGKGTLKGYELSAQKFFTFLPAPFSDFGVQANYTNTTGSNQTRTSLNGGDFVSTALAGVAKQCYNAALMYEAHGLTARLALTHRGDYVDALRTARFQFDNRVKASNYVDLSIGYQLTENFSLQLDALNLTHENYQSYQGDPIRPRDIRYGSTVFLAGIRWKL